MIALISVIAACAASNTVAAREWVMESTLTGVSERQCNARTLENAAAQKAVRDIALQQYGAAAAMADSLAADSSSYMDRTKIETDPAYGNGTCSAAVRVATNDAAIERAIASSAHCQRPVLILTLVSFEGHDQDDVEFLTNQAQSQLDNAFIGRSFKVVNGSELDDLFREAVRAERSGAYVGNAKPETRRFSFSERVADILATTNKIIEYHDDPNITGKKFLPLLEDGVIVFVGYDLTATSRQLTAKSIVSTRLVSNSEEPWRIEADTRPQPLRNAQASPIEIAGGLLGDAAEKIALEAGKKCAGI